jgi:hypothetical protein
MRKIALLALIVLVACSPTPTAIPPSTDSPIETAPALPPATQTMIVMPTLTGTPETSDLWLQVLSPLDEAVVNAPQVEVFGSASAGAVLSINDDILIVGADSQFKITVTLEDGPNLIEVVASDENGNELSVLLTVTYEP